MKPRNVPVIIQAPVVDLTCPNCGQTIYIAAGAVGGGDTLGQALANYAKWLGVYAAHRRAEGR